jgi:hypothetical protein
MDPEGTKTSDLTDPALQHIFNQSCLLRMKQKHVLQETTLVRKPRRKREIRAGLLKEILSNKAGRRPTFSGLFL